MAVAVGIWAYFHLDSRPADATWLSREDKALLQDILDSEERAKGGHGHSLLAALCQPRVLYLALIYLLIQASVYGVVFYLPSQVAGLLGTKVGLLVGVVSAIPWLCALLAAWWIPGHAERTGQPRGIASLTLVMAAVGMAASVSFSSPCWVWPRCAWRRPVSSPCSPCSGPFRQHAGRRCGRWRHRLHQLPRRRGGFIAPIVKNWAEGFFHSPAAGLYLLAGTTLLAAALVLGVRARLAPALAAPSAA